jgi:hypothetical protein
MRDATVKGFLFAPSILRETLGASLPLDGLNRMETRALLRGTAEEVDLGGRWAWITAKSLTLISRRHRS